MTLAPLSLDTLTWEDLRKLGQQQAPIASAGRWTHHAPVDPGITLLELFAYLFDQQIFVMDQVSTELQLAILALLGGAPQPARAARTVVAPPLGSMAQAADLPQGAVLVPVDGGPADFAFSLTEPALLLPVTALEVRIDGAEHGLDLHQGRPQRLCAAAAGIDPALELRVRLAAPLDAGLVGRELAVGLLLGSDADVLPQWHPDAFNVPPPVALELHLGDGASGWIAAGPGWSDGTGGLRRSGLLRFAIPPGWALRDELRLALRVASGQHAEPPLLTGVAWGAVQVHHAVEVAIADAANGNPEHDASRKELVDQIANWLPLSDNRLTLPAALHPALEDSIELALADRDGAWQDWQRRDSLLPLGSDARAFALARELGQLRFGDGLSGRVPAPSDNLRLRLLRGGGASGNHPAGLAWRLRDLTEPSQLVSLAPAAGGRESESAEAARLRVARAFAAVSRAVTAEDHAELVETADGLARHRAHVALGFDPAHPCAWTPDSLTVFVVPVTTADYPAPRADAGALARFRAILDEARLLTTRAFVVSATIRPVGVTLTIEGLATLTDTQQAALRSALSAYLHPALGGPDGTGWIFGHPLRPSELMRVAAAALPQGSRIGEIGIRLTDQPDSTFEACSDTEISPHELVWLETLAASVRTSARTEAVL